MDLFSSDAFEAIHERLKDQTRGKLLTKSKYLAGLQCPKLLWIRCNQPDLIPEPSLALQKIFEAGNQVGHLATLRFPDGQYLQEEDFHQNIAETKELLESGWRKPIYEAGILSGRLYVRADILNPSTDISNAWDIIEVKCSTKCKEVHLQDIAFQKYCYEQAGLVINRAYLMCVNNEYIKDGDIDPEEFFHLLDVSDQITPYYELVPQRSKKLLNIIDQPEIVEQTIGRHCSNPYECALKDHCWSFLPKGNVTELYHDTKGKKFDLLNQNIELLRDIPSNFKLNDKHEVQRACAVSGQAHIDHDAIQGFLQKLKYPLYFMDFETIFEAIPRFDGCWPYQQVPFQFSVHIKETPDAKLIHHEFLAKGNNNPIQDFADALKNCMGDQGSIIVYYESFEKGRIKEIGEMFPQYDQWVQSILVRIVDLLVPFRRFDYYDPAQAGSASIKRVYPVFIGGDGYKGMAISDGAQASYEYIRVTFDEKTAQDKEKVYDDLEKYCTLDTQAMVDIVNKLYEITNG